jgi:phytoene dehydrogenase-like protein
VSNDTYDVVVVGAGHNGLVAAFYFAKQGLRTIVLERREIVGGACVTEEFVPGFRASPGAYVLSMLRPSIWRDMRLEQRGLTVSAAGPSLNVFADGSHLYLHEDPNETINEVRRYSKSDANRLHDFEVGLADAAKVVMGFYDRPPPIPNAKSRRELSALGRFGLSSLKHRGQLANVSYLFTTSMMQYLDEYFESDVLKSALGWECISNTLAGPSTPGTAFHLLHDAAASGASNGGRKWGFVPGGMGTVTRLMADAAREQGVVIRTGCEVREITVIGGKASGVVLSDGTEYRARAVVSNADPLRTFLKLIDPENLSDSFIGAIRAYRCQGASMKINLALSGLPHFKDLPGGNVQPYHRGLTQITSSLEKLDADQAMARNGTAVADPHLEICFPTVHDPSLAPDGMHVLTIGARSQPYSLRDTTWEASREQAADNVLKHLASFMPDLPDLILGREVLTPHDLEERFALTGGHHLHGDLAPDQLLFMRPVRECAGYRTPIRALYLCGAGTHPGGGVTGANGRNCALDVAGDIRGGKRWKVRNGRETVSREPTGG